MTGLGSHARPTAAQVSELLQALSLHHEAPIEEILGAGELHSIFIFTVLLDHDADPSRGRKCVLRVSKPHIPTIKTQNEVAIMTWLRRHTNIRVPKLLAYDSTSHNALGSEFTLLEYCHGASLSKLMPFLSTDEQAAVMDQIIDYLQQLRSKKWDHIGGLVPDGLDETADIIPGPMVDAHFFTDQDRAVPRPLSRNASGPFPDFTTFCAETLKHYWDLSYDISTLQLIRDLPIAELVAMIKTPAAETRLNAGLEYTLSHRDMHLGNFLFDRETKEITAVLDWELAAVMPTPLWNPGNFLWNPDGKGAAADRRNMSKLFVERLRVRKIEGINETPPWPLVEQEMLFRVITVVKRIVNGGTRG